MIFQVVQEFRSGCFEEVTVDVMMIVTVSGSLLIPSDAQRVFLFLNEDCCIQVWCSESLVVLR